jgi:hypothetical protein
MASRDTPRSPDPDDWFADPDRAPSRRARASASRAEPDADDWVAGNRRRPRPQRPAFAASLPDQWVPIAAGVVLVLILLIGGLAIAGVFSSSKPTQAVTTNQIASTPTTTPATAPTVASLPAPTTTLKPGDTGAQVKRLQRALASLGYTVGTIDGDYGTATRAALIKALQSG